MRSTDFVSSDSMSRIPIEEVTTGLKDLVRKVKQSSPMSRNQLQPQISTKKTKIESHYYGNRLPQMIKLRSDTLDDTSKI